MDKDTADKYRDAIAASLLRGAMVSLMGGDATEANRETKIVTAFAIGHMIVDVVADYYANKDVM